MCVFGSLYIVCCWFTISLLNLVSVLPWVNCVWYDTVEGKNISVQKSWNGEVFDTCVREANVEVSDIIPMIRKIQLMKTGLVF